MPIIDTTGIRPIDRRQPTESVDRVRRRDDGGGGFRPQTNVNLKAAIQDIAATLGKIGAEEKSGLQKLPKEVSDVVKNILQQSLSVESTLGKGIGSTIESQRFSMEQLMLFSRMLLQMGTLADKGYSMRLSEDTQALMTNFKNLLVAEEGGETLEPVLVTKSAFELVDAKTAEQLPQVLYEILSQLAQVPNAQQQQPPPSSESMQFLKQLVKYFMPRPGVDVPTEEELKQNMQNQPQGQQSATRKFLDSMIRTFGGRAQGQTAQFNQPQGQPTQFNQQGQPTQFNQPQGQPAQFNQPQGQLAQFNQPQGQPTQFNQPQGQPTQFNQPQGQPTQFNQQGQPAQFNQQGQPTQFNQQGQPAQFNQQGQPTQFNQQGQPAQFNQPQGQPAQFNQQGQPAQFNQTQGQPAQFNQQGQPAQFNQTQGQPAQFNQQGQPAQFNQTQGQPAQFNQQGQPAQFNQQQGQPTQFNQQGQTAQFNQQGQQTQFNQQGQPAQFNQQGQPTQFNQQGQPTQFNQQGQPTQFNQQGQPTQFNQPQGQPTQFNQPQGQPTQFNQQGQTAQFNQQGQPAQFNQQGQPAQFNQQGQPAQFNQQGQPAQFNQQGQTAQFNQQGQPTQFNQQGQTAQFNQQGQPTQFNQQEQPAQFNQQEQPAQLNQQGKLSEEFIARQKEMHKQMSVAKNEMIRQNLQNTPQTTDAMKGLAQFLLRSTQMTPRDAALLQNFVNNSQQMMPELEARHLQNLLRLCQQNIPLTVQQAAVQQNLPDLPRLWAFMQMCDMANVASRINAKAYKRAGRDVADFANAMRHAMTSDNSIIQNQRSFQMMMPLYMGDSETSYPTYLSIYDENERDPDTGENKKETWLRVCVLTDHIGAAELVFRIYDETKLDMRFYFSRRDVAEEFRGIYLEDLKNSINQTNLNVGEVRVGGGSERMFSF